MKEKLLSNQPNNIDGCKILRTVKNSECFFFNLTNGVYTGETALSLTDLNSILKTVSIKSINFHYKRGEFRNWIENTLGDIILAKKIRKISKDDKGEKLRAKLVELISSRIVELDLISK